VAKNQNTVAKRLREMEKKRKAEGKRARRQRKKENAEEPVMSATASPDEKET
jgi:hypothetical protein